MPASPPYRSSRSVTRTRPSAPTASVKSRRPRYPRRRTPSHEHRAMKIEIWSDVVCPWCYIGKRRLERALGQFEHAGEVEITWRSFQLNPDTPPGTAVPTLDYLTRRFGPQATA